MLQPSRIRAITLDLDDTLWPIWPTIARAEEALRHWLAQHAPATATLLADAAVRHQLRIETERLFPGQGHDLSLLRRESIRLGLARAGEDTRLAEPAFEVFFEARQQVQLYPDAVPALQRLSERLPIVALSNGNADLVRVGLGSYFRGGISAREFGVGKPDPRIFHAAAALAGVSPETVLHVGDDARLDVLGALGAGMSAAWVNRERQAWDHGDAGPHLDLPDLAALCDRIL